MNYNETLDYIHSLGMFSLPATLDRINAVLKKTGEPQKGLPVIHIAGTNGKGSVCAMVSSALQTAGLKTGLFVSPFITDFCERIQINGEYISKEALCRLSETVRNTEIRLTEFEFITAVAFLYFKENRCDVTVLETGLGGRLDATNACTDVLVSVITKIGLDHTAILGDTVEKIAEEKCGIIKGNKTVTELCQDTSALSVIKKHCPSVVIPNGNELSVISCDQNGNRFMYKGIEYKTRMTGTHQINNALTAIETLNACGLDIPETAVISGIENAVIPARLEKVAENPTVILDGAHNPDAAERLAEYIKQTSKGAVALFSAMRDKDYDQVMKTVFPLCRAVTVTELSQLPRAESAERLYTAAKKYCDTVFCEASPETALKTAINTSNGDTVFVFGSLYLASEIRKLFKI